MQPGHQDSGADATLSEISQMSPISCQSLNGPNSGSRGPREEVKKGKSSEFNPEMVSKSNPVQLQTFGRTKALISTQKIIKIFITKIGSCGAKFRHKHDPGVVVLA